MPQIFGIFLDRTRRTVTENFITTCPPPINSPQSRRKTQRIIMFFFVLMYTCNDYLYIYTGVVIHTHTTSHNVYFTTSYLLRHYSKHQYLLWHQNRPCCKFVFPWPCRHLLQFFDPYCRQLQRAKVITRFLLFMPNIRGQLMLISQTKNIIKIKKPVQPSTHLLTFFGNPSTHPKKSLFTTRLTDVPRYFVLQMYWQTWHGLRL